MQAKKKFMRWLTLSAFIIGVILIILFWLRLPTTLPIKHVSIEGHFKLLNRAQVQQVVTPWVKTNFFRVNLSAIAHSLQQLPSIKNVSAQRIWPDTIKIIIHERHIIARWQENQLFTASGILLNDTTPGNFLALPKLSSDSLSAKKVLAQFHQFTTLLEPLHWRIASLSYQTHIGWKLKIKQGPTLIIGANKPNQQLAEFITAFPKMHPPQPGQKLTYVDLRYSAGFAARWQ